MEHTENWSLAFTLADKLDNYICNKTVEIACNEYSYFRFLQLNLLLKLQILLQKKYFELRYKYDFDE